MRMRSLRKYFENERLLKEEALSKKPQSIEDDADFERISKINDEWNRNVAEIRAARLAKERIEEKLRIEQEIAQIEEYKEEQRQLTNELVLREKVCSISNFNISILKCTKLLKSSYVK